jgi:hypothetical protein
MATETQYTVKVPLNPTGFPSTDKVVIWDTSEGMFNLSDVAGGSSCIKWYYDTTTTPGGIASTNVRFNNTDITGATEIYIHKDALSGSNDWSSYFNKLTKHYCCTLTVSTPDNPNHYIVFDFDKDNSLWTGTYLKFVVSGSVSAPLVNDSDFPTLSVRDELCLSFDLFLCEPVKNPYTNSIVTSDGSGTTVYGHTNLLFENDTIKLTGDTKFEGDRYDQSVSTTATSGIRAVHSIPTTSGESIYFYYVVIEQTNGYTRSGTVMTINDGSKSTYTDVSTPDLNGSTKGIQFDTVVNSGNLQLRTNVTSGSWDVRVRTEVLFK